MSITNVRRQPPDGGVDQVPLQPAPNAVGTNASSPSVRCQTLRKLGPLVDEAFRFALAHEGSSVFPELDAKYCDLEAHYDQLAEEVWAAPVGSWQAIVERAELAYAYADEDLSQLRESDYAATRATAELVMAVLALSGGAAWRRSK
jgi:hypothetical protein